MGEVICLILFIILIFIFLGIGGWILKFFEYIFQFLLDGFIQGLGCLIWIILIILVFYLMICI